MTECIGTIRLLETLNYTTYIIQVYSGVNSSYPKRKYLPSRRMTSVTKILLISTVVLILGCEMSSKNEQDDTSTYSDINTVGAMKQVMWSGELFGKIRLDTISKREGLYGLGPESYLTGEILINNGTTYVSRVTSDSSMEVLKINSASAPFLVYGNATEWKDITVPLDVKTIPSLEKFITEQVNGMKLPLVFRLTGKVNEATIHIQNLPKGSLVSSPKEAHVGQTNYDIYEEEVEIIGFYSTEHKGVFTHHDTNMHMHLMTTDEQKMGHLDRLNGMNLTLHLPIK